MHYYSWSEGDRFPKGKRSWPRSSNPSRIGGTARGCVREDPRGVMGRTGLSKTEADDLLDWLEANGCLHYEIAPVSESSFAVRWWD